MDHRDSAAWTAAAVGTVAAAASWGALWMVIRRARSACAQAERDETVERQHENFRRVHTVLLAADAVRNELRSNATTVIERQRLAFAQDEPAVLVLTADRRWEDAVNAVRVDRPPTPAVATAIRQYHDVVEALGAAVSAADDLADQRRLDDRKISELVGMTEGTDQAFDILHQACVAFLAKHGE